MANWYSPFWELGTTKKVLGFKSSGVQVRLSIQHCYCLWIASSRHVILSTKMIPIMNSHAQLLATDFHSHLTY